MLEVRNDKQKLEVYRIMKEAGEAVTSLKDGREHVDYVADKSVTIESEYDPYCLASINFDTMRAIVKYLEYENERVDVPTMCSGTVDRLGIVYDLRETPHHEVMRFCERLAWVKKKEFIDFYEMYVKNGEIRVC